MIFFVVESVRFSFFGRIVFRCCNNWSLCNACGSVGFSVRVLTRWITGISEYELFGSIDDGRAAINCILWFDGRRNIAYVWFPVVVVVVPDPLEFNRTMPVGPLPPFEFTKCTDFLVAIFPVCVFVAVVIVLTGDAFVEFVLILLGPFALLLIAFVMLLRLEPIKFALFNRIIDPLLRSAIMPAFANVVPLCCWVCSRWKICCWIFLVLSTECFIWQAPWPRAILKRFVSIGFGTHELRADEEYRCDGGNSKLVDAFTVTLTVAAMSSSLKWLSIEFSFSRLRFESLLLLRFVLWLLLLLLLE